MGGKGRKKSRGCKAHGEAGGLLIPSWEHGGSEQSYFPQLSVWRSPGRKQNAHSPTAFPLTSALPLPKSSKSQCSGLLLQNYLCEAPSAATCMATYMGLWPGGPTTFPTVANKGVWRAGPSRRTQELEARKTLSDVSEDQDSQALFSSQRTWLSERSPCAFRRTQTTRCPSTGHIPQAGQGLGKGGPGPHHIGLQMCTGLTSEACISTLSALRGPEISSWRQGEGDGQPPPQGRHFCGLPRWSASFARCSLRHPSESSMS